jgi:hypothetical protein
MNAGAVRKLAQALESRWSATGHAAAAFPDIAESCLREARLHESFDLAELASEWALRDQCLPFDLSNEDAAEPALTLYEEPHARFTIHLYLWAEFFRTGIHDHAIAGANVHLLGHSLHARYRFEPQQHAGPGLCFGDLSVLRADVLGPGDAYAIAPDRSFIHEVFHLDVPTVTLIVRSTIGANYRPMAYYPPGLAMDTATSIGPVAEKLWQFDRFLRRTAKSDVAPYLQALLGRADSCHLAAFLIRSCERAESLAEIEPLLAGLRQASPCAAELEAAAWHRLAARQAAGGTVRDSGHRLFMALLQTFGYRPQLFERIRERHPARRVPEVIHDCLTAMALRSAMSPRLVYIAQSALREVLERDTDRAAARAGIQRMLDEATTSPLDRKIAHAWDIGSLSQLAREGAP